MASSPSEVETPIKGRKATSVFGSLSERMSGVAKNPAKHVTLELLEAVANKDSGKFRTVVDKAMHAVEYLSGEAAPKNSRNNLYSLLLNKFIMAATNMATISRMGDTEDIEEIKARIQTLGDWMTEDRRTSVRISSEFSSLPSDIINKPDLRKLNKLAGDPLRLGPDSDSPAWKRDNWHTSAALVYYSTLLESLVNEKGRLRNLTAKAAKKERQSRDVKEAAASKASINALQARLNAIRGRVGGTRRRSQRRRRTTRKH